ncbi:MAG: hypothetical protein OXH23_06190 [bacterium]|nr:hypothetical protein [bacterium]MYH71457.1 hypothetical protein [Acidimicrobiia bacterium]
MKRVAFLIPIALLIGALGLAVPAAGHDGDHLAEIGLRDQLIVNQENLLNVYRCALEVDLELVPGGCSEPSGGISQPPAAVHCEDCHAEIELRDRLIADQEKLLNVYRCMLGADIELVPDACGEPLDLIGQWDYGVYAARGTNPGIPVVWGYDLRAHTSTMSQFPDLRLICDTVRYPNRGIIVEVHWQFAQFVSNARLTAPVAYTVAGETHAEEWSGAFRTIPPITLLLPKQPQYMAFLTRVAEAGGESLRLEVEDLDGQTESAEFDLRGFAGVVSTLHTHC